MSASGAGAVQGTQPVLVPILQGTTYIYPQHNTYMCCVDARGRPEAAPRPHVRCARPHGRINTYMYVCVGVCPLPPGTWALVPALAMHLLMLMMLQYC